MAFKPGYAAYIGLDNAAGAIQNVSVYADNFSFPQTIEQLEVTTFGSSVKRFIPGLAGGDTLSVSGPLDSTLHTQIANMLGTQAAGGSSFSLLYGPGGSVSGQVKQSVEVFIAGYTTQTGVGGRAEYSASLQVDGAVTNTTW